MILTDSSNRKFWVHFFHSEVEETDPMFRLADKKTLAVIHEGPCRTKERPCGTPSLTGESYCSRLDAFDPNVGRKRALLAAMIGPDQNQPILSKALREQLWRSYFESRKREDPKPIMVTPDPYYEPYRSPKLSAEKKLRKRNAG